jgi:hypothetical protein
MIKLRNMRSDGTPGRQVVIGGRKYGLSFERSRDANGKPWITGVVWYLRRSGRLGYLYPAFRFV